MRPESIALPTSGGSIHRMTGSNGVADLLPATLLPAHRSISPLQRVAGANKNNVKI